MSHFTQRKPVNSALLKAIADRSAPYILISCVLVLGVIAMCGAVGMERVERADQIARRV